ncbi:helix-turn-helix domain-containing protein [Streptomyces sp. NPDC005775]|uniref:helix-turn-helix domain-containing protein n=1 Tax=Streptomyces sp. NPDC005775 TaxID=3364729 RepID=UPI0036A63D0A
MGQQPNQLTPEAGPWHRWGHELREARISRRLSQQHLARLALIDRTHLGRFERAERPVPRHTAVCLDQALDACGALGSVRRITGGKHLLDTVQGELHLWRNRRATSRCRCSGTG